MANSWGYLQRKGLLRLVNYLAFSVLNGMDDSRQSFEDVYKIFMPAVDVVSCSGKE